MRGVLAAALAAASLGGMVAGLVVLPGELVEPDRHVEGLTTPAVPHAAGSVVEASVAPRAAERRPPRPRRNPGPRRAAIAASSPVVAAPVRVTVPEAPPARPEPKPAAPARPAPVSAPAPAPAPAAPAPPPAPAPPAPAPQPESKPQPAAPAPTAVREVASARARAEHRGDEQERKPSRRARGRHTGKGAAKGRRASFHAQRPRAQEYDHASRDETPGPKGRPAGPGTDGVRSLAPAPAEAAPAPPVGNPEARPEACCSGREAGQGAGQEPRPLDTGDHGHGGHGNDADHGHHAEDHGNGGDHGHGDDHGTGGDHGSGHGRGHGHG